MVKIKLEKQAAAPPRKTRSFWCTECGAVAPDHCLDEHCVISLRKVRTQQAQAPLAAVRAGEEAVRGLREEVDAAERALHADLTISRDTLDDVMIGLDLWRQGLEAAIESEVVFEQASRPASGVDRLATNAGHLLSALGDAASSELSLTLPGPAGGAWMAKLRHDQRPAARLLLCQLLCSDELVWVDQYQLADQKKTVKQDGDDVPPAVTATATATATTAATTTTAATATTAASTSDAAKTDNADKATTVAPALSPAATPATLADATSSPPTLTTTSVEGNLSTTASSPALAIPSGGTSTPTASFTPSAIPTPSSAPYASSIRAVSSTIRDEIEDQPRKMMSVSIPSPPPNSSGLSRIHQDSLGCRQISPRISSGFPSDPLGSPLDPHGLLIPPSSSSVAGTATPATSSTFASIAAASKSTIPPVPKAIPLSSRTTPQSTTTLRSCTDLGSSTNPESTSAHPKSTISHKSSISETSTSERSTSPLGETTPEARGTSKASTSSKSITPEVTGAAATPDVATKRASSGDTAAKPPPCKRKCEDEAEETAPAVWKEANNQFKLDNQTMAAKMVVGSRVVRGVHWPPNSRVDGWYAGTVQARDATAGPATVLWDASGKVIRHAMGRREASSPGRTCETEDPRRTRQSSFWRYELKLLPTDPDRIASYDKDDNSHAYFNARAASWHKEREDLLLSSRLDSVRFLALRCDVEPPWSQQVLQRVASRLEALRLENPDATHLHIVKSMPALRELFLSSVDRETLELALSMSGLVGLEAHCPFKKPLSGLTVPPKASLTWLCLGIYPLRAALAVISAHAATLETLELVAASFEPYGCPDLAAELKRCDLKILRNLNLRRESNVHFCWHKATSCESQVQQLKDMFLSCGLTVQVKCTKCRESGRGDTN